MEAALTAAYAGRQVHSWTIAWLRSFPIRRLDDATSVYRALIQEIDPRRIAVFERPRAETSRSPSCCARRPRPAVAGAIGPGRPGPTSPEPAAAIRWKPWSGSTGTSGELQRLHQPLGHSLRQRQRYGRPTHLSSTGRFPRLASGNPHQRYPRLVSQPYVPDPSQTAASGCSQRSCTSTKGWPTVGI